MEKFQLFDNAVDYCRRRLINDGKEISTDTWQGIKNPQPMWEVLDVSFQCWVGNKLLSHIVSELKPNMPWAEDHFLERVCGLPLNPGDQYKNWPFYKMDDQMRKHNGRFSHSYMERIWPKYGGRLNDKDYEELAGYHLIENKGIRYNYGDFNDVIELLIKDPHTRQAFLPIWFPEDTGAVEGQRVPCSLGYHFIRRNNELHVTYYIRSCDYLRHFRDDIYLTIRKLGWLLDKLCKKDPQRWVYVIPGNFTMHITSLHIFKNEYELVKRYNK